MATGGHSSRHPLHREVRGRHRYEVDDGVVFGSPPAANAAQVRSRRQGRLHGQRSSGLFCGVESTQQLATCRHWVFKFGSLEPNLIGIQKRYARVKQGQELTREGRLPGAVGSRHDHCCGHPEATFTPHEDRVNSEKFRLHLLQRLAIELNIRAVGKDRGDSTRRAQRCPTRTAGRLINPLLDFIGENTARQEKQPHFSLFRTASSCHPLSSWNLLRSRIDMFCPSNSKLCRTGRSPAPARTPANGPTTIPRLRSVCTPRGAHDMPRAQPRAPFGAAEKRFRRSESEGPGPRSQEKSPRVLQGSGGVLGRPRSRADRMVHAARRWRAGGRAPGSRRPLPRFRRDERL